MIKSITIENYKKFKEAVKLDFWNHKAKKVGDDFIINDSISSVIGILGKNASGKSTIIEAILFYNNLINNFYFETIVNDSYRFKLRKLHKKIRSKPSLKNQISEIIKRIRKERNEYFQDKKIPVIESIEDEVDYFLKKKYNEYVGDNGKPISLIVAYYDESKKEITHKLKFYEKEIQETIFIEKKEIYNDSHPSYLFESQFHSKMSQKKIKNLEIENISDYSRSFKNYEISWDIESYIKKDSHLFSSFLQTIDESIKGFIFDRKGSPTSYISLDDDKPLELDSLSKGTLFFISLYRYIYKALFDKKTLILIDEIENSLHFSLIKFIITIFKKRYNKMNSQLLFTTHNPHVFDRNFKSNSIYFIVKNNLVQNQERYDKNIAPGYLNGELSPTPDFHYRFQFLENILNNGENN